MGFLFESAPQAHKPTKSMGNRPTPATSFVAMTSPDSPAPLAKLITIGLKISPPDSTSAHIAADLAAALVCAFILFATPLRGTAPREPTVSCFGIFTYCIDHRRTTFQMTDQIETPLQPGQRASAGIAY